MARRPSYPRGRGARRPVRIETSAGGVVFRHTPDGPLFLLIRDPYDNWGLPKGHVERGETPQDAALREVAEETGIAHLEIREELGTIDWYFREGVDLIHKYCHFFLMQTDSEATQPQLEEGISACLWLPLDEAVRTMTYDNARTILEAAGRRARG